MRLVTVLMLKGSADHDGDFALRMVTLVTMLVTLIMFMVTLFMIMVARLIIIVMQHNVAQSWSFVR